MKGKGVSGSKTVPTHKSQTAQSAPGYLAPLILACFFLSGMTALTYEILWMRMISRIIGGAPFAISTILVVFMGGLGVGSFLASRKADSLEPGRLIRIYGFLELGIGVFALCVPVLLWLIKWVYVATYDSLFEYTLFYNLLIFAGALLVLCVPAIFMGATLPILCRFYVGSLSELGTHTGRLYGINTVGGAVGSFICGFWLIAALGVYGAMILAVVVNIGIGLTCISLGKGKLLGKDHFPAPAAQKTQAKPVAAASVAPPSSPERTGALAIFAVSGFCAMAYQVLWVKLLGLMIGPTTYSFTIVLVTFILGLAIGNLVFGILADRTRHVFLMLIATQVGAALSALLVSQLLGQGQLFFAKLLYAFSDSFALQSLTKGLTLFAFMMIPTFFLGACFPLAVKIYTQSLSKVGHAVGVAYAVNTAGAVLGSFCAGFVLIPLLGKEVSFSLVTGLQLAVPLLAGLILFRDSVRLPSPRQAAMVLALVAGIALCVHFPSWNRLTLATGKYHRFEELRILEIVSDGPGWITSLFKGADILAELEPGQLVYYGDGIGGFTTVLKYPGPMGDVEYSMANSGKMDASSRGDMKTQTLLAHFPMLFSREAQNVMVLGLASGITAGEVLHYPVKRIDVIDINDRVFEGATFFNPWNNGVLTDPRTRLIVQDGMAHLTLTKNAYDVIISEPSNPWMAGMATLFTHDFFTLAKDRLTERGIYVQWFHCYQMDWETFALVGRTFADVFPNSLLVTAEPAGLGRDYLFVGFKGKTSLDMTQAQKNIVHTQKSSNVRLAYPELLYRMIVAEDLKALFGEGLLNYDDRPHLEYAAPKLMYGGAEAQSEILRRLLAGRRVSAATAEGYDKVMRDDTARVDYADYALSVFSPFAGMVDEQGLKGEKRDRFKKMIINYCGQNILDLGVLSDTEFISPCRAAQIAGIEAKLEGAPDPALSHYFLGRLYQDNGQPDKALGHYAESIRLKTNDADRYNDYGTLLDEQGRRDEARAQFARALALRPNFLLATGNMAYSYLKEGKLDEAARYFQRVLELQPDLAAAHYQLGSIAYQKGNEKEAVHHLRAALRLQEDLPEALNDLALILATTADSTLADPASAVRYASKACELTVSSDPLYLATLAAAQTAAGNTEAAKPIAAQALKLARAQNNQAAIAILETHVK